MYKRFFYCIFAGLFVSSQSLFSGPIHEWNPDFYHRHSYNQEFFANEMLDHYPFSGDEKVLDIGCGTGNITAKMAALLPNGSVVGVDNSQDMIGYAQEHFSNQQLNLQFINRDVQDLDFENQFDLAISFTALHWVPDQLDALEKIKRSLKSSGRIMIQIPTLSDNFNRVLQSVVESASWSPYLSDFQPGWRFYYPNEYRALLEDAGLQPQRVEMVKHKDTFENIQAFKDFLSLWLPHLDSLSDKQKEAFLDDLANKYLETNPQDPEGRVSFFVDVLEAEAANFSDF